MSPLEGVLDVRGGVVCGGGGATARTGERLGGVVDMVFGAHAGGGGAVFAAEVVVGVVEAGHDDNVLEVVWVVEKVVVVVLCKWGDCDGGSTPGIGSVLIYTFGD